MFFRRHLINETSKIKYLGYYCTLYSTVHSTFLTGLQNAYESVASRPKSKITNCVASQPKTSLMNSIVKRRKIVLLAVLLAGRKLVLWTALQAGRKLVLQYWQCCQPAED